MNLHGRWLRAVWPGGYWAISRPAFESESFSNCSRWMSFRSVRSVIRTTARRPWRQSPWHRERLGDGIGPWRGMRPGPGADWRVVAPARPSLERSGNPAAGRRACRRREQGYPQPPVRGTSAGCRARFDPDNVRRPDRSLREGSGGPRSSNRGGAHTRGSRISAGSRRRRYVGARAAPPGSGG